VSQLPLQNFSKPGWGRRVCVWANKPQAGGAGPGTQGSSSTCPAAWSPAPIRSDSESIAAPFSGSAAAAATKYQRICGVDRQAGEEGTGWGRRRHTRPTKADRAAAVRAISLTLAGRVSRPLSRSPRSCTHTPSPFSIRHRLPGSFQPEEVQVCLRVSEMSGCVRV
jgi:hypothetical protein